MVLKIVRSGETPSAIGASRSRPMVTDGPFSSHAAEWVRLRHGSDEHFFSRHCAYEMRWGRLEAPLSAYLSATAPNGGPLALLTGDDGPGVGQGGSRVDDGGRCALSGAPPQLRVFTASGSLLGVWAWEHGRCVRLGWTPAHELLCVLESGRVILWSMQGERLAEFGLGGACEEEGILMAEVTSEPSVDGTHSHHASTRARASTSPCIPSPQQNKFQPHATQQPHHASRSDYTPGHPPNPPTRPPTLTPSYPHPVQLTQAPPSPRSRFSPTLWWCSPAPTTC
jgi:hypothetical protein